jgi:hypothetical protein
MDATTVARTLLFTTNPRPVRVSLGLQHLALSMVRNAFEDAMGRSVSVYVKTGDDRQKERRLNSACAIKWLRQAGRLNVRGKVIPDDLRQEYTLSIDWCSEVLNVDAKYLAWNGIHCIPGSGLKHWHTWRAERDVNRVKELPLLRKTCLQCKRIFSTKNIRRKFCSNACANASRRPAPRSPDVWTPQEHVHVGAPGYRGYEDYCAIVGVQPATPMWWRILAG